MTTEHKLREQEVQIARYRLLEREVTDPLAACLLHIIILELEADLNELKKLPAFFHALRSSRMTACWHL
jgi:hypothetical protein